MSNRKTGSDETPSSGSTENAHSATNDVLPLLVPPGDLETENYYAFLPTEPRLLGRTSAGIEIFGELPREVTEERPRKALYRIGNHSIRACWDTVVNQVEEALGAIEWTSIDVWRVGYQETEASARPVVVLIGVADEDVPWAVVAAVLRRLRTVLDAAGLADVHAELRCSQVRPLAGPALVEPVGSDLSISEIEIRQTVCRALGQSIEPMQGSHSEGALGLYLRPKRQEKEPTLWALTCRHVVLPSTDVPNTPYRRQDGSQPARKIGLPGGSALSQALAFADGELESVEMRLSEKSKRDYEDKEIELAYIAAQGRRIAAARHQVEKFAPLEARVLGAVFLSPPIEQGIAMNRRFARDWALLELDPDKFAGSAPINEVDVRGVYLATSVHREIELRGTPSDRNLNRAIPPKIIKPGKFAFPDDGILRLSGAFPLSAIQKAPALGIVVDDEDQHHLLGKRGPVTGMTWGARSEILSRVRHAAADTGMPPFTADEWAVTGVLDNRGGSFSMAGDSGAIVFTADGIIAGMVTSGSTSKEEMLPGKVDMTYVTPIALILQDIEDTLGEEIVVL